MKLIKLFFVITLANLFIGCSGGGSSNPVNNNGNGPSNPGADVLSSCDNVITNDKIALFNKNQTKFQIQGSGYDVNCMAEVNLNGNIQKVQVSGKSSVSVLPNLQYLSITNNSDNVSFLVKAKVVELLPEDVNFILLQLKISVGEQSPTDFVASTNYGPSYVRFGKGDLFYATAFGIQKENSVSTASFKIEADQSSQISLLKLKVQQFQNNSLPLEVMWYPKKDLISSIKLISNNTIWNAIETTAVVKSMVRDTEQSNKYSVYSQALTQISYWDVNATQMHALVPELYNYSLSEWQNPTFADNTAGDLKNKLKYIIGVNPNSDKKPILDTYNLIEKYQGSTRESLQTSYDYVTGKSYSKMQFDLLIETSEVLVKEVSANSWTLALDINKRSNFDRNTSLFAAQVGSLMRQNRLPTFSLTDSSPIFAKINSGINQNNIGLYFSTLSYFRNSLSANSSDAESATDSLVLSGKLTLQNQTTYFSFLDWLSKTVYLNFSKSISVVNDLSQMSSLSDTKVNLYKSTYSWLNGTVYLNRDEAAAKTGSYFKQTLFNGVILNAIQSYYNWLTGTIYLNRPEALSKTEDTVLIKGTSENQINNLKDLTSWYINTIYLNKSESLARSEKLVLVIKLDATQTQIMKDAVNWLVNTIYINKSDAAVKGESYVSGASSLDINRLNQLKDLTNWYINNMYLNKTDALARAENLVIKSNYSFTQTKVMQEAAEWLVNTVYLSKIDSIQKSESYLTVKGLTSAKLNDLKNQYSTFKSQGKNNTEALKLAEAIAIP